MDHIYYGDPMHLDYALGIDRLLDRRKLLESDVPYEIPISYDLKALYDRRDWKPKYIIDNIIDFLGQVDVTAPVYEQEMVLYRYLAPNSRIRIVQTWENWNKKFWTEYYIYNPKLIDSIAVLVSVTP